MRGLVLFAVLAICGCDHPDRWEFCSRVPDNTTPRELLDIKYLLMSNGYKRVYIRPVAFERHILIRATQKEGGAK